MKTITVATPENGKITLELSPEHTILEIKELLFLKIGAPPNVQSIVFNGAVLPDTDTVDALFPYIQLHYRFTALNSLDALPTQDFAALETLLDQNKKFFYHKKKSKEHYSYNPTGTMSIPKLIKSQPYFKKPTPAKELAKATAILADWTASEWGPNREQRANELIRMMRNRGYEFYIWQDEELVALQGDLSKELREKITPATYEQLVEKASAKHLTQDQLCILGVNELCELIDNKEYNQSTIEAVHFKNTCHPERKIIDALNCSSMNTVVCTVYPDDLQATKELAGKLNHARITHKFLSLKITNDSIDDLLAAVQLGIIQLSTIEQLTINHIQDLNKLSSILTQCKHLKHLIIKNCPGLTYQHLSTTHLSNLLTLGLECCDLAPTDLIKLIPNCPKLNSLSLAGYQRFIDEETASFSKVLPPTLNYLNLSGSNIDGHTVLNYLQSKPQLKILNLAFCTIIRNPLLPSLATAPSLEYIDLHNTHISRASLQDILLNANNLKRIHMKGATLSGTLAPVFLPALEHLDLESSDIDGNSLQSMLKQAPNLTTLNLEQCTNLSENLGPVSLPNLIRLKLMRSNVSSQALQNLVHDACSLKNLELGYGDNLNGDLNQVSLPLLESLVLTQSTASNQTLQHLLHEVSSLKKLYLTYCDNLTGEMNQVSLPLLECLNLSNSEISGETAIGLLNNVPNLTELSMQYCQVASEFKPVSMPALTHFDLGYATISGQLIKNILHHTPNLTTLNLVCTEFSELSGPVFLPSLENLDLSSSRLSSKSLQFLLANAPQLKKLDLRSCNEIKDSLDDIPLPALKELNLSESSIPIHNLEKLLAYTPNLEELNLNVCTTFNKSRFLKPQSLPSLSSLTLCYSSISSRSLNNLLQHAPKLTKLVLIRCANISSPLDLILPSLERLHLNESSITQASLYTLLLNSPKLNFINLDGTKLYAENIAPELKELLDKIPEIRYPAKPYHHQSSVQHWDPPNLDINPIINTCQQTKPVDAKITWDANTAKSTQPLYGKRIFFPVKAFEPKTKYEINSYRLQAFDEVTVSTQPVTPDKVFELSNTSNPQYTEREFKITNAEQFEQAKLHAELHDEAQAIGTCQLQLGTEWLPLPSLQPNELLTHMQITPADSKIEIRYSKRDSLYHIRKTSGAPSRVHIQYLLQLPKAIEVPLPKNVEGLKRICRSFGEGALSLKNMEVTGAEYLQAMKSQKKGACRHRAICFKTEMQKWNPELPTRIIANDLHAYIEVYYNQQWITCDLDGYATKCIIDEAVPVLPKTLEVKSTTIHLPQVDTDSALYKQRLVSLYEKKLATWDKAVVHELETKEFCQQKTTVGQHKKQLIEVSSDLELQALHAALQSHYHKNSTPVFCINSPDDLICSAPYIRKNGKDSTTGTLVDGPGGPFYEFLKQEYKEDNPPVILVNYSAFDPNDVVRFNTLLDNKRKADGIELPEDVIIIGITNTYGPNYYQGSDFYSRFDLVEACPVTASTLAQSIPQQPFTPLTATDNKAERINLFHASDWKERLLGRWILRDSDLVFEEGALIPALLSGKPIVIENGLWDKPEWKQFWQQAAISQTILHQSGPIKFQSPLFSDEGYHWEQWLTQTQWDTTLYPGGITVNPNQLTELFQRYECQGNTLNTLPGWLDSHAKKSPREFLHLNVTRDLSEDEWAQCLNKAKGLGLKVHVHCAPKVSLPESMQVCIQPSKPLQRYWLDKAIVSTDIDTTVEKLASRTPALVIDVSECDASDLLIKINGELNRNRLAFEFKSSECALLTALNQGQAVILKGLFSKELTDALTDLLLTRNATSELGRLILVSKEELFSFMPHEKHSVTNQEKCLHLDKITQDELQAIGGEAALAEEPLAQLRARLNYIRHHPNESSNKAWIGMRTLPAQTKLDPIDFCRSKEQAQTFTQKRLDRVNGVLTHSPYVFLTGLTAVGKTTFVMKHLAQTAKLYTGESKLKEWAQDKSNQRKILFIDEANLSPRLWSDMEGLFHIPQAILIDGIYTPLGANHKVVFAGNPVSYGDDRSLAPFFARHGNAVLFESLPLATIYEDILVPIFKDSDLAPMSAALCKPILAYYEFLYQRSTEEVLISPRELQMMALLVVSYCNQYPQVNPQEVVEYYAYQISQSLVPEKHRASFNLHFKEPKNLIRVAQPQKSDFILTSSRQTIKNQLDDLLQLRHYRQRPGANEAQKYGGVGGIILDGEPGIGKSELVTSTLKQQGYKEIFPPFNQAGDASGYYCLPVSLGLEEKEKVLMEAFDAGIVVVIDEINSSPMMEKTLNNLLMGIRPQEKQVNQEPVSDRPKNPGFMVIGTQNPITMTGRIAPSNALRRRLISAELPPYRDEEMLSIFLSKGLNEIQSQTLIEAYNNQRNLAKTKQLYPLPCFRDLVRLTDELLDELKQPGTTDPNFCGFKDNKSAFFGSKGAVKSTKSDLTLSY
jgi:uncharacterized protein YjbI with pentapeptide repeats